MNQLQADRCVKLAQFIEQLPDAKWDYSQIRVMYPTEDGAKFENGEIKVHCETIACALGWCPNVFPNEISCRLNNEIDLYESNEMDVFLKNNKYESQEVWGPKFFGLSYELFCEIFYGTDSEEFYGEYHLSDVTKQMVADKLYEAVENAGYEIVSY